MNLDAGTQNPAPANSDSQGDVIQDIAVLTPKELERVYVADDGEYHLKAEVAKPGESPKADPQAKVEGEGEQAAPDGTPAPDEKKEQTVEEWLEKMKLLKADSLEGKSDLYNAELEKLKTNPQMKYIWEAAQRTAGLQQGFANERKARRDLEKTQLKSKRVRVKEEIAGFAVIPDDELLELKTNDVDAYVEYMAQLEKNKVLATQSTAEEVTAQQQEQISEFGDFLFDALGFEIQPGVTQADVDKIFPSHISKLVDQKLEETFGTDAVYRSDQIRLVYDHVMKEQTLIDARVAARVALSQSINNAEAGFDSSRLDKAPGQFNREQVNKTLEDTSMAEMANMGMKEWAGFSKTAS